MLLSFSVLFCIIFRIYLGTIYIINK